MSLGNGLDTADNALGQEPSLDDFRESPIS